MFKEINGVAIGQWKNITSKKKNESNEMVEYKIKRAVSLGQIKHIYDDGSVIVRFFDINILLNRAWQVQTIWKDKSRPIVPVAEGVKKAYDRMHDRAIIDSTPDVDIDFATSPEDFQNMLLSLPNRGSLVGDMIRGVLGSLFEPVIDEVPYEELPEEAKMALANHEHDCNSCPSSGNCPLENLVRQAKNEHRPVDTSSTGTATYTPPFATVIN